MARTVKVNGVSIPISADTTELRKSLRLINSDMTTLNSSLKTVNDSLKNTMTPDSSKNIEKYSKKIEILNELIDKSVAKQSSFGQYLLGLKVDLDNGIRAQSAVAEEMKLKRNQQIQAEEEEKRYRNELKRTEQALVLVKYALTNASDSFDDSNSKLSKALKEIGAETDLLKEKLKTYDQSLKLDPTQWDMYAAKIHAQRDIIDQCEKAVEAYEAQIKDVENALASGAITQETANTKIAEYETSMKKVALRAAQASIAIDSIQAEMNDVKIAMDEATRKAEEDAKKAADALKKVNLNDMKESFSKSLKDIQLETENLKNELKTIDQEIKLNPTKIDNYRNKIELLNKIVEQASKEEKEYKKQIDAVRDAQAKGNITTEDADDLIKEYTSDMRKAAEAQKQAKNEITAVKKETSLVGKVTAEAGKQFKLLGTIIKGNLISSVVVGGLKTVGNLIGNIGRGLYNAARNAARFTLNYASDAINSASGLRETRQSTERLYGSNAFGESIYEASLNTWSTDAWKTIGLSKQNVLKGVNSLGNLLINKGLAPDEAAEVAKALMQRAADLGANFDKDTGEVVEALTSLYQNQPKPGYAYGIFAGKSAIAAQASLEAVQGNESKIIGYEKAYEEYEKAQKELAEAVKANGEQSEEATVASENLEKASKDLTKVIKAYTKREITSEDEVRALFNMIMGQTNWTEGTFEAESKGWRGMKEVLNAGLENVKDQIGDALLPAAETVLSGVKNLFSGEEGQSLINELTQFIGELSQDFADYVKNGGLKEIKDKVIDIFNAIKGFFTEENIASFEDYLKTKMPKFLSLAEKVLEFIQNLFVAFGGVFDWMAKKAEVTMAGDEAYNKAITEGKSEKEAEKQKGYAEKKKKAEQQGKVWLTPEEERAQNLIFTKPNGIEHDPTLDNFVYNPETGLYEYDFVKGNNPVKNLPSSQKLHDEVEKQVAEAVQKIIDEEAQKQEESKPEVKVTVTTKKEPEPEPDPINPNYRKSGLKESELNRLGYSQNKNGFYSGFYQAPNGNYYPVGGDYSKIEESIAKIADALSTGGQQINKEEEKITDDTNEFGEENSAAMKDSVKKTQASADTAKSISLSAYWDKLKEMWSIVGGWQEAAATGNSVVLTGPTVVEGGSTGGTGTGNTGIVKKKSGTSFVTNLWNTAADAYNNVYNKLLGKAPGGPVIEGVSYLVGEHGPEIFTPAVSGRILDHMASRDAVGSTTNNNYGGNVTLYQTINVSGAGASSVGQRAANDFVTALQKRGINPRRI